MKSSTCGVCVGVKFDKLTREESEKRYGHLCSCTVQINPDERCPGCGLWQASLVPTDPPDILLGLARAANQRKDP